MAERNTDFTQWISLTGILLVTLLVFYPTVNYDFVNWDDGQVVLHNPIVHQGLSAEMLREAFATPGVEGQYYPLTLISFALNHELGGLEPAGYHLLNVGFHLANVILLFLVLARLFPDGGFVAFVVLLFAIHPMHVEPVAWIASRKDVLYLFFMLIAWRSYLTYRKSGKIHWLVGAVLFMAISGLSKAAAIVFPFVLLATDYLQARTEWKKGLLEKIPFFLLTIAITAMGLLAEESADAIGNETGLTSLFLGPYTFVVYIVKSIIPYGLAAFHPFPTLPDGSLPWWVYVAVLPALALLWLAFWIGRKNREVAFGAGLFVCTILPFLQFIPVGGAVIAERFTYFPYVGVFIWLAAGINWFINRMGYSPATWKHWAIGCAVCGIPLIMLSITQVRTWENSDTLWTRVIEVHPEAAVAYQNRADYLLHLQEVDRALADLNACLSLDPARARAFTNRGYILMNTGKREEALKNLNKAVSLDPSDEFAWVNRAYLYAMTSNYRKAHEDFTEAIRLNPGNPVYRKDHAEVLRLQGEWQLALDEFSAALQIDPSLGEAYLGRSRAYFAQQDTLRAIEDARKAQELGVSIPEEYIQVLSQ